MLHSLLFLFRVKQNIPSALFFPKKCFKVYAVCLTCDSLLVQLALLNAWYVTENKFSH